MVLTFYFMVELYCINKQEEDELQILHSAFCILHSASETSGSAKNWIQGSSFEYYIN